MGKTILIGARNKFSAKTNKWLFSLVGLLFLVMGISLSLSPDLEIVGLMFIIIGLYQLLFGLIAFSPGSKHAIKIQISETDIEFKDAFLKSEIKLLCDEIVKIRMDEFKVVFSLENKNEVLNFGGNSDLRTEIKHELKELAENKNIPVAGN